MAVTQNAFLDKLTNAYAAELAHLTAPGGPYEIRREHVEEKGQDLLSFTSLIGDHRPLSSLNAWYRQRFAELERDSLTFCVLDDSSLSFADVRRQLCALAAGMQRLFGIAPGERVSIAMRNAPEWCVSFLAATSVGAIAVPTNSWWKPDELAYGLRDSGSRLVRLCRSLAHARLACRAPPTAPAPGHTLAMRPRRSSCATPSDSSGRRRRSVCSACLHCSCRAGRGRAA